MPACDDCEVHTMDCGHADHDHSHKCTCHWGKCTKTNCVDFFAVCASLYVNPFMKIYLNPIHWPEKHPLIREAIVQSSLCLEDFNLEPLKDAAAVAPVEHMVIDLGTFTVAKEHYDRVSYMTSRQARHSTLATLAGQVADKGQQNEHFFKLAVVSLAALVAKMEVTASSFDNSTVPGDVCAVLRPASKAVRQSEKEKQRISKVTIELHDCCPACTNHRPVCTLT